MPICPRSTWTTQVQKTVTDYSSLLRPVRCSLLFMLAYLFVIRPDPEARAESASCGSPVRGAQAALAACRTVAIASAGSAEAGNRGALRAAQLKEQTFDLVRQKPADTARAMQAWMREEHS